ncbi:MAG: hypothetical protein KDA58_13110 [Planctomycetaceae bacterium]|nr:hypothetical protein [Planctomycetaceae bacterium]
MDSSKTKLDVKKALAAKYERLSQLAGSTPKTKQYAYKALRYRRQAEQIEREQSAS